PVAPRVGVEPTSLIRIQSEAGTADRPTGDRRRQRTQRFHTPGQRPSPSAPMCRVRAYLPLAGAQRPRVDTFGPFQPNPTRRGDRAPHLTVPVAVPLRTPHTETYAYVGLATPCEGPAVAVSTTREHMTASTAHSTSDITSRGVQEEGAH